jgi:hypothetical protein
MQDRPCKTRQRRRAADMKSTYAREIDPSQLLTTSESGLHQPPTHVSSSNRRHLIIAHFPKIIQWNRAMPSSLGDCGSPSSFARLRSSFARLRRSLAVAITKYNLTTA